MLFFSLYFTSTTESACRTAYNQLLDRVDALAESNARPLVVEPAHAATVPEATSDEEDEKPIPLHPKQKDYKMIKHWTLVVYPKAL